MVVVVVVVVPTQEAVVVLAVVVVVVVPPPEAVLEQAEWNKNSIVMEKGQLIEISVEVNSESFPWNSYSCGCGGCGSGTTSRGSDGISRCSSCSGATSRGGSCTSTWTNNVVEKEFDFREKRAN